MDLSRERADVRSRARRAYESTNVVWPASDTWSIHTKHCLHKFLSRVVGPEHSVVLNAGCGGNDYGVPADWLCVNLDLSLRQSKNMRGAVVADIEALPFEVNKYDAALCAGAASPRRMGLLCQLRGPAGMGARSAAVGAGTRTPHPLRGLRPLSALSRKGRGEARLRHACEFLDPEGDACGTSAQVLTGRAKRSLRSGPHRRARPGGGPGALGKGGRERPPIGPDAAALGDEPGGEPRRRHIEGVIRNRRALRHDRDFFDPAVRGAPGHGRDLFCAALFDRHLGDAVAHLQ